MANIHVRLGDLVGWIASLVATYFFFYFLLKYLNPSLGLWKESAVLTVLILVAVVSCPYLTKFICGCKK